MDIYLFLHKKNVTDKKTTKINYRIRFLCLSLFISTFLILFAPEITRLSNNTANAQILTQENEKKIVGEGENDKEEIDKKELSIESLYSVESLHPRSNQTYYNSYEEKQTDSVKAVSGQDNVMYADNGYDYAMYIDNDQVNQSDFSRMAIDDRDKDNVEDSLNTLNVNNVLNANDMKNSNDNLYDDSYDMQSLNELIQGDSLLNSSDYEENLSLFTKTKSGQKSDYVTQSEETQETVSKMSEFNIQETASTYEASDRADSSKADPSKADPSGKSSSETGSSETNSKETTSSSSSTVVENEIEELILVYNANMVKNLSETELAVLERIVEAEAGGEGIYGKILVANVVLNRVNNKDFPDTIKSVVFQKGQFSPIMDGRYDKVKISKETKEAVAKVLAGEDYSKGALYFFARGKTSSKKAAWFDNCLKKVLKYKGHEFYIEK